MAKNLDSAGPSDAVRGKLYGAGAMAVWLALTAFAAHAAPRTVYVDAAYTGVQDGSSNHPFTTIAAALEQTTDRKGDTVVVRQGSYAGGITVWPGTFLISEDGAAQTFIQGTSGSAADLVRLDAGAVLRGFTIGGTSGAAIRVLLNADAEVTNCVLYDSGTGLAVEAGGAVSCANNTLVMNATGISLEADAVADPMRNSILAQNTYGMGISSGATVVSDYNDFYKNGTLAVGIFTPGDHDLPVNPQFADGEGLNFHLRAGSKLRDAGDPVAGFNDLDGSRNDIGADGGPFGLLDLLVPAIFVTAQLTPASGQPPVVAYFNAGASSDAWGIDAWEWDFDARDGVSLEAFGSTNGKLFSAPGGYLVTLRVRDNSGQTSESMFGMNLGDAPQIQQLDVTPSIGPAPLSVQLAAAAEADAPVFDWDVNNDGQPDLTGAATAYTFPQGVKPGLYHMVLTVTDAEQVVTQLYTSATISRGAPAVSARLLLGQAADLAVDDAASSLNGMTVHIPANALNEALTVGVVPVSAAVLPKAPGDTLVQAFELAPAGVLLADYFAVGVPVSDGEAGYQVWFYDAAKQIWTANPIRHLRVPEGSPAKVTFETGCLGLFAVTKSGTDAKAGGVMLCCAPGGQNEGGANLGDAVVFLAALFCCVFASMARKATSVPR